MIKTVAILLATTLPIIACSQPLKKAEVGKCYAVVTTPVESWEKPQVRSIVKVLKIGKQHYKTALWIKGNNYYITESATFLWDKFEYFHRVFNIEIKCPKGEVKYSNDI